MIDVKDIEEKVEVTDKHILIGGAFVWKKYNKEITINQILWRDWEKFSYNMGLFLTHYYVMTGKEALPETLEQLEPFRRDIRLVLSRNAALKTFYKMAKITGLKKRWIKKHFTVDDYAELFTYMYLYNIKGVKKNLSDALNLLTNQSLN